MIAGSVGSDFTEEFKLPSSDSQEAFDLLEERFPQQSGVTAEIVYKAPAGADSPAVRKKMEGVFAEAEKLPHVSEVASPYASGGAGAISKNGEIAYATVQYDVATDKLEKDDIKKLLAIGQGGQQRRTAGRGRRGADRGSPLRRRRRFLLRDRPARRGHHPAAHLRLGRRDGPAAAHRPLRPRRRPQPGHARHPRLRHRRVRAAAGGDDRARRRHRLRALHPHPLPQRARRGPGVAAGGDRRRRHGGARRPLRRHHRDHLADGDAAARHQLPLRRRDVRRAGGAVHDDRGADPAAGAA